MKRMTKTIASKLLLPLAIVSVVACADSVNTTNKEAAIVSVSATVPMEVFKQASCGCCGKWVDHMEKAGHLLKVNNTNDLNAIKAKHGIAPRYQSCHTAVAGDYIFEGHVPAAMIEKFLSEKPPGALGLAVPGMPVGSPGMEMGSRFDEYDVLQLNRDGSSEVYAHISAPGR